MDGEHLLVADSPEGLARHVVTVTNDAALWLTLSENGRDLAEARWSPDRTAAALGRLLKLEQRDPLRRPTISRCEGPRL